MQLWLSYMYINARNNSQQLLQQAVQTGATCNITKLIITIFGVKFGQQCCVRLHRALSYIVAFTEYKFP